ncbi:restriction endonuclease subunit S [Vibrio artabrorum]|uniref:restriction endonuclease subunit S n=1 Tax=Vibrio artabrorum TaxID=446374 RepID=UPI0035515B26
MTEQMNVPKLRFGGFSGGLLVTRLSEIINKLESGVSVNSEDVPPNSNQNGVLKTSAIYAGSFNPEQAKVITDSSELQRARLNPKKDSIIISRMNTPALVGESGYISKDYPNLFIPDRLWQATVSSQHCARWLSFLLTSPRTRFIISSKGTGTSNSMKNISKPSFLSIDAVTPTLPEQQKIAAFLSKVDEKIGLLSEKKDKLTEYKRGVMQQLFNGKWHEQDGQLTFVPPTLRFKADDGSEFPDWEEKTLGELTHSIKSGKSIASVEGPIDLWGSTGKIGYTNEPSHDGHFILVARVGANAGKINEVEGKFGVSDNTLVIDVKKKHHLHFIKASLLKFDLNRLIFGSGQPLITGGALKTHKMIVPSLEEQTQIASFLSAIDRKLDLTNSELNKAKEWKKGLLQQMFV